jgi:hypothetical protein
MHLQFTDPRDQPRMVRSLVWCQYLLIRVWSGNTVPLVRSAANFAGPFQLHRTRPFPESARTIVYRNGHGHRLFAKIESIVTGSVPRHLRGLFVLSRRASSLSVPNTLCASLMCVRLVIYHDKNDVFGYLALPAFWLPVEEFLGPFKPRFRQIRGPARTNRLQAFMRSGV